MDSLTTDELIAIQARRERAQVGPWRADTADKAGENWSVPTSGQLDEARGRVFDKSASVNPDQNHVGRPTP